MRPTRPTQKFALGLLVALCLMLLAEAVARVAKTVRDDLTPEETSPREPPWYRYSHTLGWERKPGFEGDYAHSHHAFDPQGYRSVDSAQIAGRARKKAIFIGDSNTFGFGIAPEATFTEVVDRLLPEVDAINLGVSGYTSYQGLMVLREYLPLLHPDLVVVSFSYNDRRYAMPGEADGPEQLGKVSQAEHEPARVFLERFYFYRVLHAALSALGLAPADPTAEKVRLDQLPPRVDAAAYRSNLTQIAQETRHAGVPLIFVLLRDNPVDAYHLKRGLDSLAAKKTEMAIVQLRAAAASTSPLQALGRLYLAQAYRAAGAAKRADATLLVTPVRSLHGAFVVRLDTEYNQIMREVAASTGAELVDAASVLEQHVETFIDSAHFNAEGHRRVGELLAERIAAMLALPPQPVH